MANFALMYDTLNLWLPNEMIKESGYLQRIPTLLKNAKENCYLDTGEVYYTGSILGINTSVSRAGVSFKGSFCKSYLENNFKTMTRQDLPRAFEQLEDLLLFHIKNAKVSRIDFGQNLIVSEDPNLYYPFLGDCHHYQRLTQPKTLYYQNGMRTKIFYNKKAEGKAKGQILPSIWSDSHILRYELRYTSRLPQQFNKAQIQAKDLYDEMFYLEMVNRWINEYENIKKNNLILDKMNIEQIKTPNDFIQQLAILQIKELGMEKTFDLINQLKSKKQLKDSKEYTRLKNKIVGLNKTELLTENSSLILELDKKILQIKEYSR